MLLGDTAANNAGRDCPEAGLLHPAWSRRRGRDDGVDCRSEIEHLVLRRLDQHVVLDPGSGVIQKFGDTLGGAAEGNQHIVGDLLLGHADFAGQGAIDVDMNVREVGHLLKPNVGCAGEARTFLSDSLGDLEDFSARLAAGRRSERRSGRRFQNSAPG